MGVVKMKKAFPICLSLSLALGLSGCGNASTDVPAEKPAEPVAVEAPVEEQTFEDIKALFEGIIEGAEVKQSAQSNRVDLHINTQLSLDSQPDNWQSIISSLNSALSAANELAKTYELNDVTVTVTAPDETILASGYGVSIKYDVFQTSNGAASGDHKNPPTISQDEFNNIAIGMSLSQVRDIIGSDGTLVSEYGEAGNEIIGLTQSFAWDGELLVSNAIITFKNYMVTHKTAVGLQ